MKKNPKKSINFKKKIASCDINSEVLLFFTPIPKRGGLKEIKKQKNGICISFMYHSNDFIIYYWPVILAWRQIDTYTHPLIGPHTVMVRKSLAWIVGCDYHVLHSVDLYYRNSPWIVFDDLVFYSQSLMWVIRLATSRLQSYPWYCNYESDI